MPEKKKQHYLQQMYLRGWSVDEKNINLVQTASGTLRENVPIDGQCQKDYFYGQDMVLDDVVSLFEGPMGPLLQKIVSEKKPPVYQSDDHIELLMYAMCLTTRTLGAREKVSKIDESIKKVIEEYNLTPPTYGLPGHGAQITGGIKSYPACLDLYMTLLVAKDFLEFITSDDPVVLYNPWLGHIDGTAHNGTAEKGLVIFLPMDSKHILVFYDKDRYTTKKEAAGHIVVDQEVIAELNALQIFSAYQNVYFKSYPERVVDAVGLIANKYPSKPTPIKLDRKSDHPGDWKISASINEMPRKISLDFLELKFLARRKGANEKVLKSGKTTRDEELVKASELFMEAVWDNRYGTSHFKKFRRETGV